ncbi:hypothetical protein PG997_010628 [Apiospora hydei]|uniref:Rhodopsin domain-containing protein n=1 Tax=Apiospora hydei TaxID=1337664 RepID=A0ABR1VGU6_9PEZI
MADTKSLIGLIGFYDNLDEPMPVSNYPETIIALAVTFLTITWGCVCFRLYTRFFIMYSPGWDDLFVALVLLSGTVGSICECIATNHGMGTHFIKMEKEEMATYLKYFYVSNTTYCMSTAFVKLSLLFQYLRIYREGKMRTACIVVMVITALWGAAYTFMAVVPCFPIQKYWTLTLPGKCYGFGSLNPPVFYAMYASSAAMNMTLDLVVLALPVPFYFDKNTPVKSKLGLVGLFCMGIIINFISIWRVASMVEHRAATFPTFDPTWYGPISIELATLEVNFASICASIPVFWPVLTARLDKVFVTREIKIERIHRFETVDEDAELNGKYLGDNGVELQPSHRTRSNSGNDGGIGGSANQYGGNSSHYLDEYVAAQVDPLSSMGKVELEISAQPVSRKNSRAQMLKKHRDRDGSV